MRRFAATISACAVAVALGTAAAGEAGFNAKPSAKKAGEKVTVSFSLKSAADVEVAVLDAKGEIVRHLAAGVLGAKGTPPPP
ncbi:MAG: hypothetical protein ACYTGB_00465, partial [Planctomycetota bacterium]